MTSSFLRIDAMSAFACCFWWFLLGLLLGWLLNWLLSKWTRKDDSGNTGSGGNEYHGGDPASRHATHQAASGQASRAYAGGGSSAAVAASTGASVALAAAAGFKIKGNDDLEIIEGIGPKIAGLFRESGTHTFAQLAALSQAQMHKVLENGGSRFKLANPSTWAQQAQLCHENRWAELQTLQDNLSAGVDKSDSSNA
jgi:predicted flap endonuclease-1-like 5' DNA nuclease